ncbi:MAG: 2-hydroxyacyl-CoA dehydratase [Oscillospiraceae bacterium]|nr:2-hydroxyacyl-CoA dehydratase [Oscillospiraceae bacterium]
MGNYHVAVSALLRMVFPGSKVITPPPITRKTLELGSNHSPEFVCVPFKYNLGNYIETLECGANVLLQAGGGCRYGYYAEIQEQILRDLGYEFRFVKLMKGSINPLNLYKLCHELGCKLSLGRFVYSLLLVLRMIKVIDIIELYIRENIGFEVFAGSFEGLHERFLAEIANIRDFKSLGGLYKRYKNAFTNLRTDKPSDCLKVGIVGELYTSMEPFSNYFIEKELAANRMAVNRFMNVTFLLFEKSRLYNKTLREAGRYLKYDIGADGKDSVARSRLYAEQGYDGIIHVKPFGCTPEVNAIPMLQNISRDYNIPILYFSFDSQTSETGVKTRLEAFSDMLIMKKEKELVQKCVQDI